MSDALRLAGLSKGYHLGKPNEIRVLQDVELTLNAGEVCALVAPSGAGKSTLLHIAGLLDTPDAGHVVIAGDDLTGKGDRARTRARR
ncbi:MAG: ATP-binding cassette domain-containing protein, partial [Pseudomonadota bacterium]